MACERTLPKAAPEDVRRKMCSERPVKAGPQQKHGAGKQSRKPGRKNVPETGDAASPSWPRRKAPRSPSCFIRKGRS